MDNAGSFGGATIDGQALAQNWLDLEAEYARSNFDQRHQVVATFEYTTGAGVLGGTLLDGMKGRLFKDWTFTSQLTTGSGLPLTPTYFSPVGATGIIGASRPSLTGTSLEPTDRRHLRESGGVRGAGRLANGATRRATRSPDPRSFR